MPSYKEIGGGLDDYEDHLEDEYGDTEEDGYEDEQDEIEEAALSEEALKVLNYRQKLKEQLRSKLRQENGISISASPDKSLKPLLKNFGTFFGPSMPVISDRAIQDTKRLLETPCLASKSPTSEKDPKMVSVSSDGQIDRSDPHSQSQAKTKAQILKDIRDYSFLLSDDAEIPKPTIGPKSEQSNNPSSQPGRITYNLDENKKPLKNTRVSNTCSAPQKSNYGTRCEPTQKPSFITGIAPVRPAMSKTLPSEKPLSLANNKDPVCLMKRLSVGPVGDKVHSAPKNFMSNGQRPLFKPQASGISNVSEHNRHPQNKSEGTVQKKGKDEEKLFKQGSVQANIQNKLIKKEKPERSIHLSSDSPLNNHHKKVQRAGEAFSDDECDYRSIIRNMFGYRPSRYVDVDDDDDMCMEAGFDTIQKEELRSAKIAKREDEEELAKILEEERLERLRKKAKMHKIRQ